MTRQFFLATSRKEEHERNGRRRRSHLWPALDWLAVCSLRRRRGRTHHPERTEMLVTIDERMADVLDPEVGRVARVPLLLKREDAQEQIKVSRHGRGSFGTRCPNLGRDVLDDLRVPIEEHPLV